MKIAANIAGGLLGFVFVALSLMVLLHLVKMPPPVPGSPEASFMAAFVPTGWMTVVKLCELIGGVLVAIPKTRDFGLLFLGPIVVNILCYHVLLKQGAGLVGPPLLVGVLALFLLWADRHVFARLMN